MPCLLEPSEGKFSLPLQKRAQMYKMNSFRYIVKDLRKKRKKGKKKRDYFSAKRKKESEKPASSKEGKSILNILHILRLKQLCNKGVTV